MELWLAWNACVETLRPACTRQATFAWMRIVLMGLCVRADLLGVTSLVRALALRPDRYLRLLHVLHSEALRLGPLTALWVRFCRARFAPVQVGDALVCLADGLKIPKEGRRMPRSRSSIRSPPITRSPRSSTATPSSPWLCSCAAPAGS